MMKTFQDLLKDLHEKEELRIEAKKALGSDALTINEDQYSAVVAFGKDHGYDFTEEDIHLHHAANRTLDDSELELVSGGGLKDIACACDHGECDRNWGCYNDFTCESHQRSENGGKGWCLADYACEVTFNNCRITDECFNGQRCGNNAR